VVTSRAGRVEVRADYSVTLMMPSRHCLASRSAAVMVLLPAIVWRLIVGLERDTQFRCLLLDSARSSSKFKANHWRWCVLAGEFP
jgi:hypothetical protein